MLRTLTCMSLSVFATSQTPVATWFWNQSTVTGSVHNAVWDPKTETIVLYSNYGFAKKDTATSAIVELAIKGSKLDIASTTDLPCTGSNKWGGVRVVDNNGKRAFWVSCGGGSVTSPAGLFSFGSAGDFPLGMLNGSSGTAGDLKFPPSPGAGAQTYDPFATWTSSHGQEYQMFITTNDYDSSTQAFVTACIANDCNPTTTIKSDSKVYSAYLSARVQGDQLIVVANVNNSASGAGCCAEQLLIYKISEIAGSESGPQISSSFSTIPLDGLVSGDSSAKVSHTFFSYANGDSTKLLLAMSGDSKEYVVVATLSGSSIKVESHFEVPNCNHINGVTRFENAGVTYIAATSKGQGLWLFKESSTDVGRLIV